MKKFFKILLKTVVSIVGVEFSFICWHDPKQLKEDYPDEPIHKYKLSDVEEPTMADGYPKYHSSWDWLMSVVEKIEKDYWVTIVTRLTKTSCAVHKPHKGFEQISRGDSFSKIHAIWLMVVSFIKWYNSCQKEENLK